MLTKRCPICKEMYEEKAKFCQFDATPLEEYKEEDQFLGTILDGKYLINSYIAKGSTGCVYTAIHLFMHITVAVKILYEHRAGDTSVTEKFRREAKSAILIKHPNVVTIMDFGITEEKIFYIVMEYVEGDKLSDIIKGKPLNWIRACKIMKGICDGVSAIHEKNIIHRELKPSNILLAKTESQNDLVKIIDFSLAKKYLESNGDLSPTTVTLEGVDPCYISPEQAEGLALDPLSDIYCLGIIFYEMLTGEVPFKGNTSAAIIKQQMLEQPRPLRDYNENFPEYLEMIVQKLLFKQPYDRYQSAVLIGEELGRVLKTVNLMEFAKPPIIVQEPVDASNKFYSLTDELELGKVINTERLDNALSIYDITTEIDLKLEGGSTNQNIKELHPDDHDTLF